MIEIWKKGYVYIIALFIFPTLVCAYTFEQNLTLGSKGQDVVELQNILISEGFLAMPVGVAKGYFGSLTQKAVQSYQAAHSISPSFGYFGIHTRTYMNIPSSQTYITQPTTHIPTSPEENNNVVDQTFFFGKDVVNTSSKAPRITHVSVSKAKITDRITVTGENFGSTASIYSSVGILKDKKVKDNQIIFNVSEIMGNLSEVGGLPVTFSIGNKNGVSLNYGFIMLE